MVSSLLSGLNDAVVTRVLLLANHVISSEPVAVQKLKPYAGRAIELRLLTKSSNSLLTTLSGWLPDQLSLQITPAGLLEWTPGAVNGLPQAGGLTVTVAVPDPLSALRLALQRQRPDVTIEGDAGLAEAVSWLMKNLRWDLEDDLARWLGAPPTQVLKTVAEAVKDGLARWLPGAPGSRRPTAH